MGVAHRNAPDYGIYGLLDFWQIFGKNGFFDDKFPWKGKVRIAAYLLVI